MENKNLIKISIEVFEKKYSVEMPDDASASTFMDEIRQFAKVLYTEKQIEDYWR